MLDMLVIGLESLFSGCRIPYLSSGCFTCAWLVSEAFQQVGVELVPNKAACHTSPADIAHLLLSSSVARDTSRMIQEARCS
jgi:hypothetical protein